MVLFEWAPIQYQNAASILKNTFYAGTYAYGKSENRTDIVDGLELARRAVTIVPLLNMRFL
jgi:hypothetical protein